MIHETSQTAVAAFAVCAAALIVLSVWLARKTKSVQGYYAADGRVSWFVNGVALAGDYLSAAWLLGICGTTAFFGYDGFLVAIGCMAGWMFILFVVAEPVRRLGKLTFADALDAKFKSRAVRLAAGASTVVVCLFLVVPEIVVAGAIAGPLLGAPRWAGVLTAGTIVTAVVAVAGMVSATWVQFIKAVVLVVFCALLVRLTLQRGFTAVPRAPDRAAGGFISTNDFALDNPANKDRATPVPLPPSWSGKPYARYRFADGREMTFRVRHFEDARDILDEAQVLKILKNGTRLVNGVPQSASNDLRPVGAIAQLAGSSTRFAGSEITRVTRYRTGPLDPPAFLRTLNDSQVVTWARDTIVDADGATNEVFYPVERAGADLLTPGVSPAFAGLRSQLLMPKLDFISLMLGLFCGTAALPHILIRYYTVRDAAAARQSSVVAVVALGFLYLLAFFAGLGAMTSGAMDPANSAMALPLLARSLSRALFVMAPAVLFVAILGTLAGLLAAVAGAVAHDLTPACPASVDDDDGRTVRCGRLACAAFGAAAILLGVLLRDCDVSVMAEWALGTAASAHLPALLMVLFWRRTTARGVVAAVTVGLISSLGWILLSPQAFAGLYHVNPDHSPLPFSQPALLTMPLALLALVVVSLRTRPADAAPAAADA